MTKNHVDVALNSVPHGAERVWRIPELHVMSYHGRHARAIAALDFFLLFEKMHNNL